LSPLSRHSRTPSTSSWPPPQEHRQRRFAGGFSQPNVVIADFINYDDLFPHVDVFVTSGGFGSNLAAFLHGVPVVAAGKREGKNDINARIGYHQLGIDLRTERPKPAAIRKAVHKLLNDPAYAGRVADLRAELESYDPIATIENALLKETVTTRP
jgi:UDP:flavonoid glycosyltransferase YjiC (YdhE family)